LFYFSRAKGSSLRRVSNPRGKGSFEAGVLLLTWHGYPTMVWGSGIGGAGFGGAFECRKLGIEVKGVFQLMFGLVLFFVVCHGLPSLSKCSISLPLRV
jgi:hypothetical protein